MSEKTNTKQHLGTTERETATEMESIRTTEPLPGNQEGGRKDVPQVLREKGCRLQTAHPSKVPSTNEGEIKTSSVEGKWESLSPADLPGKNAQSPTNNMMKGS
jgi:hypothetical protein